MVWIGTNHTNGLNEQCLCTILTRIGKNNVLAMSGKKEERSETNHVLAYSKQCLTKVA